MSKFADPVKQELYEALTLAHHKLVLIHGFFSKELPAVGNDALGAVVERCGAALKDADGKVLLEREGFRPLNEIAPGIENGL